MDIEAKRISLSMREATRTAAKPMREEPFETTIGATIGERLGNIFESNEGE